jgi:SNF2 family DNA or RNA helicase
LKILYEDGVYYAKCTYEERTLFKQAGWRFSVLKKRWETESDTLADLFIDVAQGIALERLSNVKVLRSALISASSAIDSDKEFWRPKGLQYLGFQKAAIDFLMKTNFALLADQPGLGKTISVLGTISNLQIRSALIIVPASLKYNWLKEANKWARPDVTIGVTETIVKKKTRIHQWPDTDIVITTYDMLGEYSKRIHQKTWDLVACDEAQLLCNKEAKRTKNILGGGKGKNKVYPIPTLRMIFATGTPILKRPVNLWPIIEKCDPVDVGRNYMNFVMRYCGGYHGSYGLHKDGATNLEELQFKMRSKFMIRRMKIDVLKELPHKIRQVFELPQEGLTKVVRKEMQVFEENLALL